MWPCVCPRHHLSSEDSVGDSVPDSLAEAFLLRLQQVRRVPRDGSWHHTHASAREPSPSTSATTSFTHLLPFPTLPIPRSASQKPRAKPQPPTQVPSERPHPPAQTAFQHVMFSQTPCSGVAGWLQCPHCPRTAGRLVGVRSAEEGVFQECRWWPPPVGTRLYYVAFTPCQLPQFNLIPMKPTYGPQAAEGGASLDKDPSEATQPH